MVIYWERAGREVELSIDDFREALGTTLEKLGHPKRVLALPPDHTRFDSRAGELTVLLHELLGDRLTDVMPALGTHHAMSSKQLAMMFPGLPESLIRIHRWRTDVVTLGHVDSDFVHSATEGIYSKPWPAQVNKLLIDGQHDLIFSMGQVVPHEVIGMANYNKNIFVGTGGSEGIHESHFLSAVYGMERIMGRGDTPLRRVLNKASEEFCRSMPIVYAQTVVEALRDGRKLVRGLFIGDDHEVFWRACQLSAQVNCFRLDQAPQTVVVRMDGKKYHRTWLANKAIYRTRMAVADEGKLIILAPGVEGFGEDPTIDRLIQEFGYRTTAEILEYVAGNEELQNNLSAAAHLIHGSSEKRFEVVYCPGKLSQEAIENVGYQYADSQCMQARYEFDGVENGWNTTEDGESYFYIDDPGLGLWMYAAHPHAVEPTRF